LRLPDERLIPLEILSCRRGMSGDDKSDEPMAGLSLSQDAYARGRAKSRSVHDAHYVPPLQKSGSGLVSSQILRYYLVLSLTGGTSCAG
jgi:hypothetical protein